MKGEIFQMCSIITSAKHALHTNTFIQYEPQGYELDTVFCFLPEQEGEKGEVAEDVDAWYAKCLYNKMSDVKMLIPTAVKDRRILGFVNTSMNAMICFYPDDTVHLWQPHWAFDKEKKGWHIMYREHRWDKHPEGKPVYADNTEEFKKSLEDIMKFAEEIECPGWAGVFKRSVDMLAGGFDYAADDEEMLEKLKKMGRSLPPKKHLALPPHNIDMFEAASNADVFGGMGSWNDAPAGMAHQKNREQEYNDLSNKLYSQLTLAMMYAVNEW